MKGKQCYAKCLLKTSIGPIDIGPYKKNDESEDLDEEKES